VENYSTIIENFIKTTSFVLIDLIQKGDQRNVFLEVFIDKKEKFGIDEIAEVNRNLRKIFEEKNIDKEILKLIVSSPGAENPFKFFWQMEKHIGREVEIKTKNDEIVSGKLEKIIDFKKEEFQVLIKEKKETKILNYLFGDISEAKIKLSFKK
jgi:ribosome maturation factor RimP